MRDTDDNASPLRRLARLQPPPGGEAALRAAMGAPPSRALPAWSVVAASAGACLSVLLAWPLPRTDPLDARIEAAVRRAVAPKPEFVVRGARVERMATRDANVRLYRIVALRTARAHAGDGE